MKHIFLFAVLFCFVNIAFSQNSIEISNWLSAGDIKINKPAFNNTTDINNKEFSSEDFLKNFKIDVNQFFT
ncbi:MAG: hypothetical protein HC831_09365 [Chloroflexia bacterium]|nr:hypothetical protein [Chloroflexia bacterium]